MTNLPIEKADLRGVPSLVWRAGQERRLRLILEAAGNRALRDVLVDGCGVGAYVEHLVPHAGRVTGLDIETIRVCEARQRLGQAGRQADFLAGAGEFLPFPDRSFDL